MYYGAVGNMIFLDTTFYGTLNDMKLLCVNFYGRHCKMKLHFFWALLFKFTANSVIKKVRFVKMYGNINCVSSDFRGHSVTQTHNPSHFTAHSTT